MATKTRIRLGLDLRDEGMKRRIKVAAAKRGMTVSDFCLEAIEHHIDEQSGEVARPSTPQEWEAFIERMDKLREEIGPIGVPTWQLVEEGRRR
ncbi:MAG: hypothetical protein HYY01_03060 [Chloroflexi bacterium]|nr:hypothetical protein [Chloroflexota bacterium]